LEQYNGLAWGSKTIDATGSYLAGLNDLDSLDAGKDPVVPRIMNQEGY
jgi:hypothetical protein